MKSHNSILKIFLSLFLLYNYNANAQKADVVIQIGHTNEINLVEFTKDNKNIITAADDGNVILWDLKTKKQIRDYKTDSLGLRICNIEISPNSKYISAETITTETITTEGKQSIIIWDTKSGKTILIPENKIDDGIYSICFSPDEKYFAYYKNDSIKIWDLENSNLVLNKILEGEAYHNILYFPKNTNQISYAEARYLPPKTDEDSYTKVNCIISLDILNKNIMESYLSFIDDDEILGLTTDCKYLITKGIIVDTNYAIDDKSIISLWDLKSKNLITELLFTDYIDKVKIINDSVVIINDKIIDLYTNDIDSNYENIINISADRRYIALNDKNFNIIDIKNKDAFNTSTLFQGINKINYVEENNSLIYETENKDLYTFSFKNTRKIYLGKYLYYKLADNHKNVFAIDSSNVYFINSSNYKINEINEKFKVNVGTPIDVSSNLKYIIYGYGDYIKVYGLSNNKEINKLRYHTNFVIDIKYLLSDSLIVSVDDYGMTLVWNIFQKNPLKCLSEKGYNTKVTVDCDANAKKIIISNTNGTYIYDLLNYKLLDKIKDNYYSKLEKNGKYIITGFNNEILLRNLNDYRIVKNFRGHNNIITGIDCDYSLSYLFSIAKDNRLIIWNINTEEQLASFYNYGKNDFIMMTPDNYYFCSKGGINAVAFVIGNDVYPPEQFDIQYNRPDIVLERIGLADPELIKSYREAYYKRLRKLNFDTTRFNQDFHLPEINIVNEDKIEQTVTDKNFKLEIKAEDTKYKLDRINVWVNEVPIFGINGISLRELNRQEYESKINIELSDSINIIQVSTINEATVESLRKTIYITYKPEKPYLPKTYFVGIGVSRYQNKDYKLNYAAKDIQNLDTLFRKEYKENYVPLILLDEQVTTQNISKIRETLMQTNVNDLVIVSLSGHGMLDTKYNFYYGTCRIDFKNPSSAGLMYDSLDRLLDSIPARKKVLFIDACNSGEVDKDTMTNVQFSMYNEEKKETKGHIPDDIDSAQQNSKLGLRNSFQLMQEIFVNLSRGNGAVVISAARGFEPAFENTGFGTTGGNGAFTACIIEALTTNRKDADTDKNGVITINELKNYVIKRVEEMTNGKQKPTTRSETLQYDFRLW